MKPNTPILAALLTAVILLSGCATTKRAAITGTSAAVGAGAGYALGPSGTKGKAISTAVGAVVGGVAGTLAQGRNDEDYQQGVDDGYTQASSDDIKRLYWAKQALEKKGTNEKGVVRYYVFEDEGTTADGRKLAPEKVAIPVFEPERE